MLTHDWAASLLEIDQSPEWLGVSTVFEDDPFVVYRLDSADPERQPQMMCAQVEPPAWQVIPVESD